MVIVVVVVVVNRSVAKYTRLGRGRGMCFSDISTRLSVSDRK